MLDSATTDDTAVWPSGQVPRRRAAVGQLSTSAEHGARAARCDLFVDGDERVPPSLAREVRERLRDSGDVRGFWIPRRNVIAGVWVRHAGWWPDLSSAAGARQCRFDESGKVHEVAELGRPAEALSEPLLHLNYETFTEFGRSRPAMRCWRRGRFGRRGCDESRQPRGPADPRVSAPHAGAPGRSAWRVWTSPWHGDGDRQLPDLPQAPLRLRAPWRAHRVGAVSGRGRRSSWGPRRRASRLERWRCRGSRSVEHFVGHDLIEFGPPKRHPGHVAVVRAEEKSPGVLGHGGAGVERGPARRDPTNAGFPDWIDEPRFLGVPSTTGLP